MARSQLTVVFGCSVGIAIGALTTFLILRNNRTDRDRGGDVPSIAAAASAQASPRLQPIYIGATSALGDAEKAAIRSIIREELTAASAPTAGEPAVAGVQDVETVVRALPPAKLATYQQVRDIVDRAVETKSWNEGNRLELRGYLAEMPDALFRQQALRLIDAVNNGAIHWEGIGPVI